MKSCLKIVMLLQIFLTVLTAGATNQTPFNWQVKLDKKAGEIDVSVAIPQYHYLYLESTTVKAVDNQGKPLQLLQSPKVSQHHDEFSGDVKVYQGKQLGVWRFKTNTHAPFKVTINGQGCRSQAGDADAVCFIPEQHIYTLGNSKAAAATPPSTVKPVKNSSPTTPPAPASSDKLKKLFATLKNFPERQSAAGYMDSEQFLNFLSARQSSDKADLLADKSIWLVLLLILVGGVGLNFTPCVLPMIPVNLAIIGAGTGAASKNRGFILGGAYGLGIALAYGVLGLSVVLAGAQFGALNSSVWFNISIAVIFLLLALAMFDLFNIDLSKYGGGNQQADQQRGKIVTAFIMGVIAALLAGACVAPVLIAVLLYSANLYAAGNIFGLLLPFLLGLGMGLPWPFAGAGMAVIPKPGMWMVRIKQFFGIIILLAAVYYGYIAFELVNFARHASTGGGDQIAKLQSALLKAEQRQVPVLIDFWATWCKNCAKMEGTTLQDSKVKARLSDFEFVKFQAEDLNAPATKAITEYFKIKGLPSYIILKKR